MANANQKAKAGIIATRQLLKSERMAGFKATSSALDAIYGNLSTTQNGIGRSQTVANRKTMAALARIAGKTDRATGRLVRGGEAQASRSYGSVVGAAVDRQSSAVEAHKAAASAAVGAEVKAGLAGVKGATNVLAITKAGAKAAAAGAAGQLADALQYRAKNDAQVVAQMQQARMTAQLQFQTWKKQQEYLQNHPENAPGQGSAGMAAAAKGYGDASINMRDYLVDHPDATVEELVTAAAPADQNEQVVYTHLAKALTGPSAPTSRSQEIQAIMDSMLTLYPNFAGHSQAIRKAVASRLDYVYKQQALGAAEQAAKDASGDPSIVDQVIEARPTVHDLATSGPFAPDAFANSSPGDVANQVATSGPLAPDAFDHSSPLDVWRSFWAARPWAQD